MHLICPKCKEKLIKKENQLSCINNHSYDIAKQKYVNLLLNPQKPSNHPGDDKDSLQARRVFLDSQLYQPIVKKLIQLITQYPHHTILDIGCGEGYYMDQISKSLNSEIYAFDISKEAIILASKYKSSVNLFVANATDIPIENESMDIVINMFSFFNEAEVNRVLSNNGVFIHVASGTQHLMSLKAQIYQEVNLKPFVPYQTQFLQLIDSYHLQKIFKTTPELALSLLKMTPHYYRMPKANRENLQIEKDLEIEMDVQFTIYQKTSRII